LKLFEKEVKISVKILIQSISVKERLALQFLIGGRVLGSKRLDMVSLMFLPLIVRGVSLELGVFLPPQKRSESWVSINVMLLVNVSVLLNRRIPNFILAY
jgi:hypothetical protein